MATTAAVYFNNIGVQHLEHHDYEEAIASFRSALTSLSSNSPSIGASPRPGVRDFHLVLPHDYPNVSTIIYKDLMISKQDEAEMGFQRATRCSLPSERQSAIFRKAIRIPPCDSFGEDDFLHRTIMSACCIFNIALMYHLQGVEPYNGLSNSSQSGSQRSHLEKANTLYEKCSSLLGVVGLGCYVGVHPIADLLSMAVLNNHGQLCIEELSLYDKGRECMAQLSYVTKLVSPSAYCCNRDAELLIDISKQNFCLNVFLLRPPTTANIA